MLSISIPGCPQTKLRPRFSRRKGRVVTYDSQCSEKETAKWQIKARVGSCEPLGAPLSVTAIFIFKRPKSRRGETYVCVKPDLDNLLKWVMDVGNGILWYDDKQIVSVGAVKIYGCVPKTVLTVSEMV